MDIYFYSENENCINSKKAVLLGNSTDVLDAISSGASALGGIKKGDFSNSVVCLGDFDGVHKGHRALFSEAQKSGRWGVLIFDRNIKNVPLLTTMYEKIAKIKECGADFIIIAEFSKAFSHKTPAEFVGFLKNDLKVSGVVAGYYYRFGYKASGDADALEKLCKDDGISVKIIDELKDASGAIKSTRIREAVKNGNMPLANELLGYPYLISGKVVAGFKNGRKMGIPTANIDFDEQKLLPKDGVYFGKAEDMDAVINVGKNPTFDAKDRTVEVHIMDFSKDLNKKHINVSFLEKIRDEKKFLKKEELTKQIKSDIDWVKNRKRK